MFGIQFLINKYHNETERIKFLSQCEALGQIPVVADIYAEAGLKKYLEYYQSLPLTYPGDSGYYQFLISIIAKGYSAEKAHERSIIALDKSKELGGAIDYYFIESSLAD